MSNITDTKTEFRPSSDQRHAAVSIAVGLWTSKRQEYSTADVLKTADEIAGFLAGNPVQDPPGDAGEFDDQEIDDMVRIFKTACETCDELSTRIGDPGERTRAGIVALIEQGYTA